MFNSKKIHLLVFWNFVLGLTFLGRADAEPPNIIHIMVDDLGYGDLGCYGQKTIKTPQLDSMAKNGIKFTDYYSGNTVCRPLGYLYGQENTWAIHPFHQMRITFLNLSMSLLPNS